MLALRASAAEASPVFDLTGDMQGLGGLQGRSVPGGSAAAYFNPALLVDTPANLHAGFMLLSQQIAITLDGRSGPQFDVPRNLQNATRSDFSRFDNYPIPTQDLQFGREGDGLSVSDFEARPRQAAGTGHETFTYMAFGLVVKAFDEFLSLAVHGLVPFGEFTTIHAFFNDEREQYFSNSLHPELYSDRMTAPSLAFGAGVRVTDDLSLGVGATLSLKADAVAPTYVVDTADLTKILIDMDTAVNVSLTPHFGVAYTLLGDRLRLTATAHPPRRMEFATSFTFLLANGVEQSSGVPFVLNYTPWMLAIGTTFDVVHGADHALTVAGTLVYAAWNTYVDRHGDEPTPAYAWGDTFSPTLGVRFRSGPISALADASYVPTPVPPQRGRSNYVDNDRVSGSLGGELGFGLFGSDAQLGLQLQAHDLLSRRQVKLPTPTSPNGENIAPERVKDELPDDALRSDTPVAGREGLQTNNPGWPGFASEGWVFVGSLYLRVSL